MGVGINNKHHLYDNQHNIDGHFGRIKIPIL